MKITIHESVNGVAFPKRSGLRTYLFSTVMIGCQSTARHASHWFNQWPIGDSNGSAKRFVAAFLALKPVALSWCLAMFNKIQMTLHELVAIGRVPKQNLNRFLVMCLAVFYHKIPV
jgi:hypothetical protein